MEVSCNVITAEELPQNSIGKSLGVCVSIVLVEVQMRISEKVKVFFLICVEKAYVTVSAS